MSSRSDYEGMTVKTLQSELRSRGLPTAGKKQELIDRLVHADEDAKASSSIDTQPSNQEEMADDDQGTSAIPTEPSSTEGSDQLTKPEDRKVDDETNQPVGGEVKSPVVGSKRKGVDEETDDAEPSAKRTKGDQSSDEPIVDASTPSTSDNVASSIVVSPSATSTTLVKSPPPVSSSHAVTSSSLNALISSAPSPQPSPSSSSTLSTSSTSASPSSSSASSASSASSTSSSSASSSSSLPTSPPTAPLSSSSGQSTVVRVKGFTRPMRPHDLSALESLVRGFGHVSRYYMHPLRIYLLAQFDSPTAAEVCIKGMNGLRFPEESRPPVEAMYATIRDLDEALDPTLVTTGTNGSGSTRSNGNGNGTSNTSANGGSSISQGESASSSSLLTPAEAEKKRLADVAMRRFNKTETSPHLYWMPTLDPK